VADLWPGTAEADGWIPADSGVQVTWNGTGMQALLSDWSRQGNAVVEADRRVFMAVSGEALTTPAWEYVAHIKKTPSDEVAHPSTVGSTIKVTPTLVQYYRSLIATFRRMDDVEGASVENLKHLRQAIGQVCYYLKHGTFSETGLGRDMVLVMAQLSQIGGWMAYDAEQHGLAQRYYRTGLHAAYCANDRSMGAYILASMAYQAAETGQLREAEDLASAALEAADNTHSLIRAVVLARVAHVHAVAGNLYRFRFAVERMKQQFETAQLTEEALPYLYWFNDVAIDTLIGQGVLLLAMNQKHGTKSLLDEADKLFEAAVSIRPELRPRDAALHSAWLARAHVTYGDVHQGLDLAETAIARIKTVVSPRTHTVLRELDRDLANAQDWRKLTEIETMRKRLRDCLARAQR
jgi:hypothetical protein